jgi:hypothetical protein
MGSTWDRASYVLGWMTFGAGFAAVFWLGRPDLARAAKAATIVVVPAAIAGLGVVWICSRLPLIDRRRPWLPAVHGVLALVYSGFWIGCVFGLNRVASAGTVASSLPPRHVVHWHLLAGCLLYAVMASVTFGRSHALEAQRRLRSAELRLVQAQLDPHFLYNTLHAIFALGRDEPAAGERALETFVGLLRYVVRVHREELGLVLLQDEWDFTRRYIDLEAMRLRERLRVTVSLDQEILDWPVPPLILQPLVENAIRHGIEPLAEGGEVRVEARREGDHVTLRVADDGNGSPHDAAASGGIGLRGVRVRLEHLYGESARSVEVATGQGIGYAVTLRIPLPAA